MKKLETLLDEIEITKKLIKYVEEGYGRDKCKSYSVGCPNCMGQVFLGWLDHHLDLLKWDLETNYKTTKVKNSTKWL